MAQLCNEICRKYQIKTNRYSDGIKRCSKCEVFIKWDGIHCPCCTLKLRDKKRWKSKSCLAAERSMDLKQIV
jgi:hypothetical protein